MSSRAMKQAINTASCLAVNQNRKYKVFLGSFECLLFSDKLLYIYIRLVWFQCKVTILFTVFKLAPAPPYTYTHTWICLCKFMNKKWFSRLTVSRWPQADDVYWLGHLFTYKWGLHCWFCVCSSAPSSFIRKYFFWRKFFLWKKVNIQISLKIPCTSCSDWQPSTMRVSIACFIALLLMLLLTKGKVVFRVWPFSL